MYGSHDGCRVRNEGVRLVPDKIYIYIDIYVSSEIAMMDIPLIYPDRSVCNLGCSAIVSIFCLSVYVSLSVCLSLSVSVSPPLCQIPSLHLSLSLAFFLPSLPIMCVLSVDLSFPGPVSLYCV